VGKSPISRRSSISFKRLGSRSRTVTDYTHCGPRSPEPAQASLKCNGVYTLR
jgi:hypothetical protein